MNIKHFSTEGFRDNIANILGYYMDRGILLETKTLVEIIRNYIRDLVRVFSRFFAVYKWLLAQGLSIFLNVFLN